MPMDGLRFGSDLYLEIDPLVVSEPSPLGDFTTRLLVWRWRRRRIAALRNRPGGRHLLCRSLGPWYRRANNTPERLS